MIISKPLAAIIGGLFFAAILGFIPAACDASAQSADYSMLNHEQGQTTAERLNALDSAARAAEIEALKQYEQADYDFMRGDAEIPQNQSAEDSRYDIAQGTCEAEDLPPDIRQKCDEYNGAFYACEWPLS